jgi:hypothetical protein
MRHFCQVRTSFQVSSSTCAWEAGRVEGWEGKGEGIGHLCMGGQGEGSGEEGCEERADAQSVEEDARAPANGIWAL